MFKSNDAEYLVKIINGKRHFDGKPIPNSVMVWKCTVEGCDTPPKPQRRGQYENKMKCNVCSNREKSKNPETLLKRGKAISKAIASLGDKWSKVATENMASEEVRARISENVKRSIKNDPNAIETRRKTALKNNEITGFGTSDFSKKIHSKMTQEEKVNIRRKIIQSNIENGKKEHLELMAARYPEFQILEFDYPDNTYKCPKGHIFIMRGNNFLKRGTCTECSPRSNLQLDFYLWCKNNLINKMIEIQENRRVLYLDETSNGNRALEIDIYSPTIKFGIEVHGLYSHKEKNDPENRKEWGVDKNSHKKKADLAQKHGIKLLQFFEDEICNKLDLVRSITKSKLGIFDTVVYARECEIRTINERESKIFLNKNHLQGNCRSFLKLGLFYKDELVSILTIRNSGDNIAEIARFCNKQNNSVVGGFSRLLKKAEDILKNNKYEKLITYSDRRYSDGSLYNKNGFVFIKNTEPDFFWIKGDARYPRQISWAVKPNDGKTIEETMKENKYHKIYGAGHSLWEKDLQK